MTSQTKQILLLGAQHGDELLGEKLYEYIQKRRSDLVDHVSYMTGNPKARRRNVRYIESDMNRSYNKSKQTYEERRATRLLQTIKKRQEYGLVLDLHTTSCNQPPCLIISGINPDTASFIAATTIERIVLMKHDFVTSSLIGNHQAALSIEVNQNDMQLAELCEDITRYIAEEKVSTKKIVYEVTDTLKKTEMTAEAALELENFTRSEKGYYPVLVGEKSYREHTEYLGFKAYKTSEIRL